MPYLMQCRRFEANPQYPRLRLATILEYPEESFNQPEFINFKCSDTQGRYVIESLQTNIIDLRGLAISQAFNGWAEDEMNSEVKDLSNIPTYKTFIQETARPVEIE